MAQKKTQGTGKKAGIGIGLTATAAAVAGAYFLYGSKKAPQNRKKVKSWALKAKAEVLEGLEKAEELTEDEYKNLVDSASRMYGTVKNATKGEVTDFRKEMLSHWKDIQKNPAVRKLVARTVTTTIAKKVASRKSKPKKSGTSRKRSGKKTTSAQKTSSE